MFLYQKQQFSSNNHPSAVKRKFLSLSRQHPNYREEKEIKKEEERKIIRELHKEKNIDKFCEEIYRQEIHNYDKYLKETEKELRK